MKRYVHCTYLRWNHSSSRAAQNKSGVGPPPPPKNWQTAKWNGFQIKYRFYGPFGGSAVLGRPALRHTKIQGYTPHLHVQRLSITLKMLIQPEFCFDFVQQDRVNFFV